jgi:hypothetical protein
MVLWALMIVVLALSYPQDNLKIFSERARRLSPEQQNAHHLLAKRVFVVKAGTDSRFFAKTSA